MTQIQVKVELDPLQWPVFFKVADTCAFKLDSSMAGARVQQQ